MSWKTQLHLDSGHGTWTAATAADQAARWVDETSSWLHTEQAAFMRCVPEQDAALGWWASGHSTMAPIEQVMPHWLATFHNITAADIPPGTSPVVAMMNRLCSRRATQIAAGHIAAASPQVMAVLATVSRCEAYLNDPPLRGTPLGADAGTLVLPQPLRRTGAAEGGRAAAFPGAQPTQTLRALSWITESIDGTDYVRILDWSDTSGHHGYTGNTQLDEHVKAHQRRTGEKIPPLMFNGEWCYPKRAAQSSAAARTRIHAAAMSNDAGPWTPRTVLPDEPHPLAVRLVAALGDAVTSGLIDTITVPVTRPACAGRPERREWATVCADPAPAG